MGSKEPATSRAQLCPLPLPSGVAQGSPERQSAVMEVHAATKSDIPAIMLIERVDGYARLVGRWDADQHAAEMENPSSRYLLARQRTETAGFAMLRGVGSANQCVQLKRIAVQNAGHGIGSRLLRSVLQVCFDDLAAHRVELFVFVDNERAYRAYLKTGFVEEGVIRDLHRDADGNFRSMRLMSLLKPEWAARTPQSS
jgi:ribosomal protein S18 acetylase RimI-like enzyme